MSSRIKSDFGSLADRTARMNPSPPDRVTAQHVWLDDHIPGLLVRWRRDADGWLGMVCYLSRSTDEPVAEWFPADRITPLSQHQDKP